MRRALESAYRPFVQVYNEAVEASRTSQVASFFPAGSFPPGSFVPLRQ